MVHKMVLANTHFHLLLSILNLLYICIQTRDDQARMLGCHASILAFVATFGRTN